MWPFLLSSPIPPLLLSFTSNPSPLLLLYPSYAMNIYSLALLPALLGLFVVSVGFLSVAAHCAQMRISLTLLIFSLLSVLHVCQLPRLHPGVLPHLHSSIWRSNNLIMTFVDLLFLCFCVCVCMSVSVCVFFFVSPFVFLAFVVCFTFFMA